VAIVLWLGFAWMPSTRLTSYGARLAFWLTPAVAWLLNNLDPVFSRLTDLWHRYFPPQVHSGLYEKDDLLSLIQQQRLQPDNRIPHGEIEMALHALTFGDKQVADVLIPKRVVAMVKADEPIGPSLMDELHKSGHSRFPVFEGKDDNIVGILYLRDLITTRKTGTVKDLMKPHITYVHEDFTLYQTLQAFLKTKRHLFLTVNSFEEFTGIITIEDIIEQIVGKAIVDEFDKYDDLRAVAAAAAKKDHDVHEKKNAEPEPTETTEEVVE
jgi:CBS domain containing-hemolysin-like protein